MSGTGAVEVWRGGVNAWECDENDHLNVRFYVAHAMQGLAGAAAALGMPDAFSPHGTASLVVRRHHVRFLKEARIRAPLHMTAGLLELADTGATFLLRLVHSRTGETAATFVAETAHVTARDGRPFAWPERARLAAEQLKIDLPPDAGSRGVAEQVSPPTAEDIGHYLPTGQGVILPQDCDVFGRMRAELLIARVSDGLGHMFEPLRAEARDAVGPGAQIGGAALEYRLTYFELPQVGDHVALRSAYLGIETKLVRFGHVLVDPRSGKVWGSAEHVSVNFDLQARKAVALPDEAVQRLRTQLLKS